MRASLCVLGRHALGLAVAQEMAVSRGGRCLSESYKNAKMQMKWQCAQGHRWSASLFSLRSRGSWCPHCAGNAPLGLDTAIATAKSRGGKCLSTRYINSKEPMVWECAIGHKWTAKLGNVRNKATWCPSCAKPTLSLHDARQLAASRGGRCLSSQYVSSRGYLQWQCALGHTWRAQFANVKYAGSWCPTCAQEKKVSRTQMLEVARNVARARAGYCLGSGYINNKAQMRWRCREGHEWQASLNNIKDAGSWCPECATGKSQNGVKQVFEDIFHGHRFYTRRPRFLRGMRGRPLELDGYCQALHLAFEFNGRQHYDPNMYWNRGRSAHHFEDQCHRDRLKVLLCQAFGVRLVVVPWDVQNTRNFIWLCLTRWFRIAELVSPMLGPGHESEGGPGQLRTEGESPCTPAGTAHLSFFREHGQRQH
ncbi:unnamed protein product [Prorocentrum cordatum]|uniref:Treble clef zinc finger domain-containing protein n=1 Tax=Prorocentrum cordatum TaxID=2364126 RepID=A0ABN9V5A8_9DINO|nr:unnamed protein product [Polarella glacialis]